MNRTEFLTQAGTVLLTVLGLSCDSGGEDSPALGTSTTSSTSSSGQAEVTSGSQTSSSTGSTSDTVSSGSSSSGTPASSTSTGDASTTAVLDPETACRSWPDPETCPPSEDIGLPIPHDCVPVDVYVYDSPDACVAEFETRCEVLATSINGGIRSCSFLGYAEGWFRELEGGGVEFWGVYPSGDNPPVEPGFSRCLDQPEMCACECEHIQPE